MSSRKFGIWWLFLLAWNSAVFAWDVTTGRYWLTAMVAAGALWCGWAAFHTLTTLNPDPRSELEVWKVRYDELEHTYDLARERHLDTYVELIELKAKR